MWGTGGSVEAEGPSMAGNVRSGNGRPGSSGTRPRLGAWRR
jgi:hypothetical protein